MVRIISDTSTLYSIKEGLKIGLDIAPLSVFIKNKTYIELEEIETEEFIKIINEGYIPTSSQPSIGKVIELYNKYPKDEIINITMADGLSGTYNTACMAKTMVDNPDRITVLNSKTLCGPHRYLVETALNLSSKLKSRCEIIEKLKEKIESSKSFLIPHDFEYLRRGGRLSSLACNIGKLLKIVPILTQSEDGRQLIKYGVKRTFKNAIETICNYISEIPSHENHMIYLSHACAEDLVLKAKEVMAEILPNSLVEVMKLTPAFTTQGGPSCIAIQIIKK